MRVAWECVVKRDHVFRQLPSGVLYEVAAVTCDRMSVNAGVRLRPVEGTDAESKMIEASALCGDSNYERLPDDEGDTVIWGGGTKIGPVGAR